MRREEGTKARRHGGTKGERVRRVAVVTGTRAEYGLLRSTIRAIQDHPKLKLQLIVTGMHLLPKFGRTIEDIRGDGLRIGAQVPMQRGDDRPLDQAAGLARGVDGIARFLVRAHSEIVLVLGDRIEAMAGALAGVTTGRLVTHVHGGDVALGDFDDSFRHAITKLTHLHLPATPAARDRILRMGESPHRVYVVGAPGLDRLFQMRAEPRPSGSGFSPRRFALLVQHPIGRATEVEQRVMVAILAEVVRTKLPCLCVYPNSDRGHDGIVKAIRRHQSQARNGAFTVIRSLDHDEYLRQLTAAAVLIGNSSSGMIEAAAAGTPAVNVGARQQGRECDPRYVFHAQETAVSIRRALRQALRCKPIMGRSSIYGDGQAGRRIAELLAGVPLHDAFRKKIFADSGKTEPSR